ncbi:MAG: ECF-type sigma factor [Rubripirellula sp.]
MSDVTMLLNEIEQGSASSDALLPLVYDELRQLAAAQMRHERNGQTLQATALVHEAFLRLTDKSQPTWENRRHFFGAAALAMQRILVEQARRKKRQKHGGDHHQVELDQIDVAPVLVRDEDELLALDEALGELEREDPRKSELVRLRYFAGLTEAEAAKTLGISRPTASRWWTYSKAWLFDRIRNH